MARDRDKHAYFTVGIPRDSGTFAALTADAAERGISLPQLIAVRLADWYAGAIRTAMLAPLHHPFTRSSEQAEVDSTSQSAPGLVVADALHSRAIAAVAAWGEADDD
jgi:hypothetical protein